MKFEKMKAFRTKMQQKPVFGVFSKTMDPAIIECIGYSGFDFVIMDLEHGPNTIENSQNLIRAAEIAGVFPIIRVKEDNFSIMGEALDIGAGGIQVPQVCSRKDAEKVVQIAKFAPEGMRGACRYVRSAEYTNIAAQEYFREANENIVIAQLEGKEALENLNEIIQIDGIDVVFIGPYDLAQSMGIPGGIDKPELVARMQEVVQICGKHEKLVGTFVDTIEQARYWLDAGVQYIAYSVDMGMFYEKCFDTITMLRKL